MEILCRCATCGTQFKIDAKYAGRKAKCPKCATVMVVSESSAAGSAMSASSSGPRETAAAKRARFLDTDATDASVTAPDLPELGGFAAGSASQTRNSAPKLDLHPTQIQIDLKTPIAHSTATHKSRPKSRKKTSPLVWIAASAVAGMALVIGLIYFGARAFMGKGGPIALRSEPSLVLDWPESERRDASLRLDNAKQPIPKTGMIKLALTQGDHKLSLQRRGYSQIDYGFSVDAGDVHTYKVAWEKNEFNREPPNSGSQEKSLTKPDETFSVAPLGFAGWLQMLDQAKRQAAPKNKDILMVFSGSDWSQPSIKMASAIFSTTEFLEYAKQRFVLVVIDKPGSEAAYNQLVDAAQNSDLRRQFLVRDRDIPVVVLMDSAGAPYAIDGYFAESVDKYLQRLNLLAAERRSRDSLIKQASANSDSTARLQAAEKALEWLKLKKVTRFYPNLIADWVRLARKVDPQNEQGMYEQFFEEDWQVRIFAAALRDQSQLGSVMNDLQIWSADHKFRNADRAVRMHLVATDALLQLGEEDKALTHIETALTYTPTDAKLKDELQSRAKLLNSRGQLSSGSGFVVDRAGHILTNRHVIEGPGRTVVRKPNSNETIPAELIAQDADHDIALLRVDPAQFGEMQSIAVSKEPINRGARVAAFGYPLGDAIGTGLKFSSGFVMGLPEQSDAGMILFDGRINPGNSGGPLCNNLGHVIGMVKAKSATGLGLDSFGMAIPANELIEFLKTAHPTYVPFDSANDATKPLEWDEVDKRVKDSVLMILKIKDK